MKCVYLILKPITTQTRYLKIDPRLKSDVLKYTTLPFALVYYRKNNCRIWNAEINIYFLKMNLNTKQGGNWGFVKVSILKPKTGRKL